MFAAVLILLGLLAAASSASAQSPLNGAFFFGAFQAAYDVSKVLNDPIGEGVPDPDFPDDGVLTTLVLAADAGFLPGRPDRTFGDGLTPIPVHVFNNGDALFLGNGTVVLNGSINGAHAAGNSRMRYAKLALSQNGLQALDTVVELPAGTGFSLTANTRRFEGRMPLGIVSLGADLQPTGSFELPASAFGLPAFWFHHEQLPLVLRTASITWLPGSSTFKTAVGQWEFARESRQNALDALAARRAGGADIRGEVDRFSNDHALRNPGDGEAVTVKVDADGIGILDTRVPIRGAPYFSHFPIASIEAVGGQVELQDGVVRTETSMLAVAGAITMIEDPNCPGGGCDASRLKPILMEFTPADQRLQFAADLALVGAGAVPTLTLSWGNSDGEYTHRAGGFADATFEIAGTTLLGRDATQPDARRPAELLLSGFGAPGDAARVERPGTAAYADGLANYPGLNLRAAPGAGFTGLSRLSGDFAGPYALHEASKYYVRSGGVSGRHQALAFDSTLQLFGFKTTFTSLGLAFLDNGVVDSRTSGSVHVPGPADVPVGPSGFDLAFGRLEFGCRGEPGEASLVSDPDGKNLSYWLTQFRPLSLAFEAPTNVPPCKVPVSGFLVVAAEVPVPPATRPVFGTLAFQSNGDLATGADGSRVDSRLHLPSTLLLAGPGKSTWRLGSPSRANFNRWSDPTRPAQGFVNFFGSLDVPYFKDIKVQVHAQPGLGDAGIALMGGWHAEDGIANQPAEAWLEGGRSPFEKSTFDAINRGFAGGSVEAYRDPSTPEFNPRAEQTWAGILHFDERLQWRPAERGFRDDGTAPATKERVFLFELEHRAKVLNAAGAEIAFGAEPKLPRISSSQFFLDAIDQRTGLYSDLVNAINASVGEVRDRSGIAHAADRLDELVSVQPDVLLRPALDDALRPLAKALAGAIQPAYEKAVADAIALGMDAKAQAQAGQGAVCKLFAPVTGEFTTQFNAFKDGTSIVTNLAHRVGAALEDVEDGLSSVLTVLEKKPVKDAVPPRDERHVVVELAKRFATPERLGTYGAIVGTEFAANLADSMQREYLPESEPAFAQVERAVREVQTVVLDVHSQFNSLSGPMLGTLDDIVHTGSETALWLQSISNTVCQAFSVPVGAPEAYFREVSPAQLERRLLTQIEDEFLRRIFSDRIGFLFRSTFGQPRGVFRGAVDEVFAQINEMIRRQLDTELIRRGLPLSDSELLQALDALDKSLRGTRVRGHARINAESLEELRVDGHFQFGLYGLSSAGGAAAEGIEFDAWYEAHQYQGDSPAEGCREAGVAAATVDVGAKFSPGGGFGAGTKVGLNARASFGPAGKLLGVGGGIIFDGDKDIGGASVKNPSLNFSFGKEGNYLGGTVSMSVKDFAGGGSLFIGEACNLAQLTFADPDLQRVLDFHKVNPATRIRGFWARADGTFPMERLLPIPPLGCLLHLEGRGGIGYYLLVVNDAPFTATGGVLVREGVSGKVFCVLSGTGEVTLLGGATLSSILDGSGPYVIGHGFVEGSVLGFSRRKDFEFNARLVKRGSGFDAEFHVPFLE